MSHHVGPNDSFHAVDNRWMQFSPFDVEHMQRALSLAEQALFITSPNPRVGCVITAADGRLLGQGHTQQAGGAHAEIMALRDAQAQGLSVKGATAYVTLEPCAHHGRTGPCCEALINAGITKVVASLQDPNPQVAGQGFAKLRAAGIQVDMGLLQEPAHELNIGFFQRMQSGKPWLRMKIAQSLDGHTALNNGQSQWLTQGPAREDGHRWRARACAVLSGIGTVLEDDPMLNVRGGRHAAPTRLASGGFQVANPFDRQALEGNPQGGHFSCAHRPSQRRCAQVPWCAIGSIARPGRESGFARHGQATGANGLQRNTH